MTDTVHVHRSPPGNATSAHAGTSLSSKAAWHPNHRPRRIGISLGDNNGIGPEITFAALQTQPVSARRAHFVIIGSESGVVSGARLAGTPRPPAWHPGQPWPTETSVVHWNPTPNAKPVPVTLGRITAAGGRAAATALRHAVAAIRNGDLAGLVTAPVCKESLHRAGINVPGQTEWLASLSDSPRVGMLLSGGGLRVILATRHLALTDVPASITVPAIQQAAHLLSAGLSWMGIRNRRIGVCAVNPHAGDGGIHGDEDTRIVAPAVRALRRQGLDIEGPIPADVIFHQARQGRFGGIVAMYHDQGLAPLKTVAFNHGINISLGLPFVRTSPDHGTAFDIAGRHAADARSMIAAIRLAVRLVQRPNPWLPPPGGGRS